MTKQVISIGTKANDGSGDTIRAAFTKTNNNFTELYSTTISLDTLKGVVANSTSFTDFQTKISAL